MKNLLMSMLMLTLFMSINALTNLYGQEDERKIEEISKDADWILLRDAHLEVMDQLVNSKTDLGSFNFFDEEKFLDVIEMDRKTYLNKAAQIKAAALRLQDKYELKSDCETCEVNNDELNSELQKICGEFQAEEKSFSSYETSLTTTGSGNWCCPIRFYICCLGCAATISAFPAYLICCALCFSKYCC